MRGTSPALIMSVNKLFASHWGTHVDSDDDAEESGIDARYHGGQALLARAPVSCNRLSAMVLSEAERMLSSLITHPKRFAILPWRKVFLVEGLFWGTRL